jgi:hypothetical protein
VENHFADPDCGEASPFLITYLLLPFKRQKFVNHCRRPNFRSLTTFASLKLTQQIYPLLYINMAEAVDKPDVPKDHKAFVPLGRAP